MSDMNEKLTQVESPLRAFVNCKYGKETLLEEFRKHRADDEFFRQGSYVRFAEKFNSAGAYIGWDYDTAVGGCLVGCAAMIDLTPREVNDTTAAGLHNMFPVLFGIPYDVATVADSVFEELNGKDGEGFRDFPVQFAEAIPVGADLTGVAVRYEEWVMSDENWEAVRSVDPPGSWPVAKRDTFLDLLRNAPVPAGVGAAS